MPRYGIIRALGLGMKQLHMRERLFLTMPGIGGVSINRAVIDNAHIDESTKKNFPIIDIEEGPRHRFMCKLGK